MDAKHDIIQETIKYEPGTQFKLHHNFGAHRYPNHWHNAVEIVMPVKNDYDVEVSYQPYTLSENDILIVPAGEVHSMNLSRNEGQRIILQFGAEALSAVTGLSNVSYVYSGLSVITADTAPELYEPLRALLTEILEEYLSRNDFYEAAILQKIIGITLLLIRKKRGDSLLNEDFSKRNKHTERLNECLEYIDRNFSERLTLEGVAQIIGYSKYHFSRWFQEYTGVSFHDYLSKVRIGRAETLLVSSEQSMTEIAMESGFQSTNSFNRVFRKYNGCTPTYYRYMHYPRKQADTRDDETPADVSGKAVYTMRPPVPHGVPGGAAASDAVYRTGTGGVPQNPVIWADIPDPDVIRAGDAYYMTSTTMYFTPGIPVMKSYDLVHWEIVNYVYDILDSSDCNALRGGSHAYGKGSWASSLRCSGGVYYVAVCSLNTEKTYIFKTEDIENGQWSRFELDGVYHDPSLLFDDDGRVYLVYGGGTIRIAELRKDASGILPGGAQGVIIENANAGGDGGLPAEGSHIYKINGYYYLFLIAWPPSGSGRRIQLCYRAESVLGPYQGRVVLDDDMGYDNNGIAQGGIVDTPDGKWYAMLFQDRGAVGRIPVLVPVTWEDGFPVFGENGCVPAELSATGRRITDTGGGSIVSSDEFYAREHCRRDYGAANSTAYREGYALPPEIPSGDTDGDDLQLIVNGDFTDGTAHWDIMEVADTEIVKDESLHGTPVLFVSGRTTTASGPRQIVTGKVKPGGIYEALACVKYTSGPPEKVFNICMRNGSSWEGIRNMGSGRLIRGQWGYIRGTYTVPPDADLSESSVFPETPWTDKPKKETDLMDYYVRHISVTEKPAIRNTAVRQGENDLPDAVPAPCWQFNHNPDNSLWSLTERPGYLRLKSAYLCDDLTDARNTLTQRTFGPFCTGSIALETGGMKDGDTAGLAALQELYGYIGVKMAGGTKYIVMVNTASELRHPEDIHPHMLAGVNAFVPISQERVYLRAEFDFGGGDSVRFYYSLDELGWHVLGGPLPMQYRLSHFTGYRFALFYFAAQIPGGFADFDYFRLGSSPAKTESGLTVRRASFIYDKQALGIKGTEIRVSLCMDAPEPGNCKGLYLSFAIPRLLSLKDISLHTGNITGDASYSVNGNRLLISVTGSSVPYTPAPHGRFADFRFVLNEDLTEDTTLTLRPDYIYADGGSTVYLTHETCAAIKIYAPGLFTRGWHDLWADPTT